MQSTSAKYDCDLVFEIDEIFEKTIEAKFSIA